MNDLALVEVIEEVLIDQEELLEEGAKALCKRRREAIDGRKRAGVEEQWDAADDAYEGIDATTKLMGSEQTKADFEGYAGVKGRSGGVHSTAILNITRLYVNSAAARVSDMLLPTDEIPFGVVPTPRSDISYLIKQIKKEDEKNEEENKVRVEKAYTTIKDWMVECNWQGHARRFIKSAALYGTGILKGPMPVERKFSSDDLELLRTMLDPAERLRVLYRPGSEFVPVRNFYPDPSCGNDIQNGSFVFERTEISKRKLKGLKEDPSYICDQICKCLEEGPKEGEGSRERMGGARKNVFDLWLYWGPVPKGLIPQDEVLLEDLDEEEDLGESIMEEKGEGEEEEEDEKEEFAYAVLCNNRIIKVARNTLDIEEFPFDILCWQARDDYWAGIGVADHAQTPQRGLTASLRNLLDNASLSSGPQIIFWKNVIEPKDGQWEIYPRKLWFANVEQTDEGLRQVQNAITTIDIPQHINEVMTVIKFFMDAAEQSTGISVAFQGLSGENSKQTLGGMQMQTNMASSVLRTLARDFDDITEAQVNRYYEWIKTYGPEDAIGDLQVQARGSSTLVERDLQVQALTNLLPLSLNTSYNLSPAKMMEMFIRAQRFDYSSVKLSEEEKAALQPGTPVQVEVAKIREESAAQIAQLQAEIEKYKVDVKAAIEQIRVGAKGQIEGMKIVGQERDKQKDQEPPKDSKKENPEDEGSKMKILSQLGLA